MTPHRFLPDRLGWLGLLGWLALPGACAAPPEDAPAVGAAPGSVTSASPDAKPGASPAAAGDAGPAASATGATAYDPRGGRFVVHEWGTLTNVAGSDGVLLPGLQHEEEDLPGFVADRLAQAALIPGYVQQKMETPVTYFYAPGPRVVKAAVRFPQGLFSQWYPYVKAAAPAVWQTNPNDPAAVVDPFLMSLPILTETCQTRLEKEAFTNGLLDWGEIEILGRDEAVALAGPLGETSWGFARKTAANPLRVRVGGAAHHEKFLFYRGLGRFDLPLTATTVERGGTTFVVPANAAKQPMRSALLLHVDARGGGLVKLGDVPAEGRGVGEIPAPTRPHGDFVRELRATLEAALQAEGLYADEARAMVDTWERSYFLTPGPRLLYVLPQAVTDAIIPLDVQPRPDELARVMVIRVELMTPALERALVADVRALGGAEKAAARQRLVAHGRFAEPYLSRALALVGPGDPAAAAGRALLEEVRGHRRWASLAVQ